MANPEPLENSQVILGLVITLGLVFALVFWYVRLQGPIEPPFLWRQGPAPEAPTRLKGGAVTTAPAPRNAGIHSTATTTTV
ncbi:hypothetical protein [Cyanobium sp. Morenito 9A2]|uniref:hypothetical protein n=1 Tax=Cyanobium sp. Morenito 9A2 TaxID=2823718 RepID=UPI0020CCB0E7|nr:hypothetical protein [Cyanobium sp. Morenito 9A2]MCP9849469.1 hypothetical protein [Cyanobium sp. Morenito 9A2]